MMKSIVLVVGVTVSILSSSIFAAGDAAAGKAKVAICASCHGAKGISMIPMYPNLAGQKSAYTFKQLKAFKDKTRIDSIMTNMVANLSETDMKNIAAYYESLK
jgi:cytochrome c553